MTVREHYEKHLGNLYSWMMGDYETRQKEFFNFLVENDVTPTSTRIAIDLGAGHGIQSLPLAKLGFNVISIDFNRQLLDELKNNAAGYNIEIKNDDIKNVQQFADRKPELIICCGDTLLHLANKNEIEKLISDIGASLVRGGTILLSFRDYTTELTGDDRFILVENDAAKILTCILDYDKETVRVTDLLYEKTETGWTQKVSSYNKVRILPGEVINSLETNGLNLELNKVINRMIYLVALKQ